MTKEITRQDVRFIGGELVVLGRTISRDAEGRYCLNDIHAVVGNEPRHKPSNFLQLLGTQELIAEILITPDPSNKKRVHPVDVTRGRYGRSHACLTVTLDYLSWISADFRLAVYQAYDESRTKMVAGEADIRPLADVLQEAMEKYHVSQERPAAFKTN